MDASPELLTAEVPRAVTPRDVTSLTLILPAFNEQDSIQRALLEAHAALRTVAGEFEIIVVDDGSSDLTASLAEEVGAQLGNVTVLRQPQNMGYGAALKRGFAAASCDLVAFTDADCQFDLHELDRLTLLARHYDIACGYRIHRQDPWHRLVYSKTYNLLVRTLLGTGVRDCDCALKIFRREFIQSLDIENNNFFVNAEILAKARLSGRTIAEVGVTHRPRLEGTSTVSLRHVIPVGQSLLRFWWNRVLFTGSPSACAEASSRWTPRQRTLGFLTLLVCSAVLLFANLSYPLNEPDETRYAQIPLEMLRSGDWLLPTLDGRPYLDKPPLLYWMTAASYAVFGTSEMAARLPCALCAVLTVLVTFWLGKRLVGDRSAWCGALCLLLSGGFVLSGRFILMDGPLTLMTTTCLLAAAIALRGRDVRMDWWVFSAMACALGMMVKGPVAMLICLPPLLASRWLSGHGARVRVRDWGLFFGICLLVTLPWFCAIALLRPEFGAHFLWKHHVLRFVKPFDHEQPWWFYFPVLAGGMLPVSLLFPPLAIYLFSRSEADRRARHRDLGLLLLSAVWIIGFFSISRCKLPTYIVPALPAICLLLGSMLDRGLLRSDLSLSVSPLLRGFPRWGISAVLWGALVVAAIDFCMGRGLPLEALLDVSVAACSAVMLYIVGRMWFRPQFPLGWSCVACVAYAGVLFVMGDFVPEVSLRRSVHLEAAHFHEQYPLAPVIYFGHDSHSASLHLPATQFVEFEHDEEVAFASFVEKHPVTLLIADPGELDVDKVLKKPARVTPLGGRGRVQLLSAQVSSAPAPQ